MASRYIYLLSSSNSNSSCVRFEWSSIYKPFSLSFLSKESDKWKQLCVRCASSLLGLKYQHMPIYLLPVK